jgi:hypothetical protein
MQVDVLDPRYIFKHDKLGKILTGNIRISDKKVEFQNKGN